MGDVSEEVAAIPTLKTPAGPRDEENWGMRVKEEYIALIQYIKQNKERDNDWFKLQSNKYVLIIDINLKKNKIYLSTSQNFELV